MTPEQLRERLATFAAAVNRFCRPLFAEVASRDCAEQLIRASAAAMANHRAAGRGRSHAEFTAKLGIAVEEIDESQGWLLHLERCGLVPVEAHEEFQRLLAEAGQLAAILTAGVVTARRRGSEQATLNRRPRR